MAFLEIQTKEDSPEKLAAIEGLPEKYFLKAPEFNAIVNGINSLANLIPNRFTTDVTFEFGGASVVVPAARKWVIKGLPYRNNTENTIPVLTAPTGKRWFVYIVATTNNEFVSKYGPAVDSNPAGPIVTDNELLLTIILMGDGGVIEAPVSPISLEDLQLQINELNSNKAPKHNVTFTGSVKVPNAINDDEAISFGQATKNRFFSISASQTSNIIQIAFKDKVTITALEAITNVDSFSDFVVWKGNTALTARTTIAQVNTDIAALTSSEVLAGYTVQFKLNLIAGQSNASAILKTVKS